jgi:hypothetical protein
VQRLSNPLPYFLDARGALLDGGFVYIGVANQDPESSPLPLFSDPATVHSLPQPLRTLGGLIVSGQNAVPVFFDAADYSIRVRDANGEQVYYVPSVFNVGGAGPSYQPFSDTLTLLAQIFTTTFGRALLAVPNQAGLQAVLGLADALPKTGGTMTGNITRVGAGVHTYHADPAMTGGRIYVTAADAADPTSQPGDIWLRIA